MNEQMLDYGLLGISTAVLGLVVTLFVLPVVGRNIAVGFCVAIAVAVLAVALGGTDKILVFWDAPSFLLVVLTVVILVSGQRKWVVFLQGLRTSLFASVPGVSDAPATAALFRYVGNGTLCGSVLWALTGLLLMLSDLDPNKIGASIIVSLLAPFYSVMLSVFLFYPIAHWYEQAGA